MALQGHRNGHLKCRDWDLGNDTASAHPNLGDESNLRKMHMFIAKKPKRSRR